MMSEEAAEAPQTNLRVAFVDQTHDAEVAARHEAIRRRQEWTAEGGIGTRFLKGIWDNIAGDYNQLRYQRQALREISENGNIYAVAQTDEAHRESSIDATLARFSSQYEEAVHTDAGERREELAEDSELKREVKKFIQQSIEENWDEAHLREERTRILNIYHENHSDDESRRGIAMADNLIDIRNAVVGATEHGESLDRVLANMSVVAGESRSGVRTEARYNAYEKLTNRINQTKVGAWVGPEVIATTVTLAGSLLRFGGQRLAATAMTLAPGVAAGAFAGLRENRRVKDERAQHMRERAEGRDIVEGSRRREQMEETRYETVLATELEAGLRQKFFADGVNLDNQDELKAAYETYLAAHARVKLSDTQNVDLISYTTGNVEEQRLALDIALAEAKTTMHHRLEDSETRRALGMALHLDTDEAIAQHTNALMKELQGEMSEKDHAFQKLKARRVATAAATGLVTGLVIGAVAQEGIAALDGTREGLVEQLWNAKTQPLDGQVHQTLLESWNSWLHGDHGESMVTHHEASTSLNDYTFGKTEIQLTADDALIHNSDGSLSLVGPDGHTLIEHLTLDHDGSLSPDSLTALQSHGLNVVDSSHNVDVSHTETKEVSVNQYVHNHASETTHVTRDLWYDNDTAAYDRNELRLEWSGAHGGSSHNFQLNTSSMSPDGSFHDGQSANWHTLAEQGKLKLAISASTGTQDHVFMVDIKPDGSIDIPKDGPAGQFFNMHDGQAEFNGAYAEVVQVAGTTNGVEHIDPLATLVGNNNIQSLHDTVTTHSSEVHYDYTIRSHGYNTTEHLATYTEMAPVIPVVSREGLEDLKPEGTPYYNSREYLNGREVQTRRGETSPRLLRDPDALLNPREELKWYKKLLEKNRGKQYVEDIEQTIAASPELSNISPETKTIITIPVNAAGKIESDKIYDLLTRGYGAQPAEYLEKAMILLHTNWFDSYNDDENPEEMKRRIEKTRAEIERAKADNPHLKIASIETEWKRAEVLDGVIGRVGQKLNDAALLSVERAMERGQVASTNDVLIIRNDSDAIGIGHNYLRRFIDAFENDPHLDILTGTTTFDNTKATRIPGFVMAANFMQSLDLLMSKREHGAHTGGANFGLRASTLAAVGSGGFGSHGVGSDDVELSRRIISARQGITKKRRITSKEYYNAARTHDARYKEVARHIAKRVDARIDTDSDREEALYQQGIPIVRTWDQGFDANGYQPRDARLGELQKENVSTDASVIVERIRNDMEGSINAYNSEPVIRTALAVMFNGGSNYYKLSKRGGRYKLDFTPEATEFIQQRLLRDSRGRFDPYGSRKLRQMYGQVAVGARRQPTHRSMSKI